MVRDRKNIRIRNLLTQKQVAEETGISERTIRRYEKGTSNNATLEKYYAKLNINTITPELVKRKGEKALKQYEALRRAREKEGDASLYSEDYFTKTIGGVSGLQTEGLNEYELNKLNVKLDKFLSMETSSVKGWRTWKRNIAKASRETTGERTKHWNILFWRLFNRIKNNPSYWQWLISNYGYELASEQIIEDIKAGRMINDTEADLWEYLENLYNLRVDIENTKEDDFSELF